MGRVSFRRAWVGAFVVGMVLAFSLPSIALAANTATFKSPVPAAGSHITNSQPTISLIGYDRYGVRASGISMWVGGVRVAPTFAYNNLGNKSFRLSYAVPVALSTGAHRVTVKVHDLRSKNSTFTWVFTTGENVPPVTTSNAVASYTNKATILFFAMDNAGGSGVDHTAYTLDGVAGVGAFAFTDVLGAHTLVFWSVDKAGNVEAPHTVNFVVGVDLFAHAAPDVSCTAAGCHHGEDVATIHWALKCTPCHAAGVVPTTNCTAAACHGTTPPANHDVHLPILSSGPPACTQATCHGTNVLSIHVSLCSTCHTSTDPKVVAAISAGGASCETCHGAYASLTPAHAAPANTAHAVSGICYTPLCHNATDVGAIHTNGDDPPGCAACHDNEAHEPTTVCGTCHPNLAVYHEYVHADATGDKSSACTTCHGTDIPTVHEGVGCVCHTASFLRAEMAPFLVAGAPKAQCVDCHKGNYAAHGFNQGKASGHNTTTYGTVGGLTKWDGSEGVVVKDSVGATITQEWPLPTASVFWSQSKALNADGTVNNSGVYSLNPTDSPAIAMANRGGTDMASKINKTVGWDSVVLCQDCHTNLNSSMGPQGANAGQVGLDSNYPDDWTKAEITSFDPTGMRSIETTRGSGNPYYTQLGGNVYMPAEVINGTLAGSSIETTTFKKYGAGMPDQTTTVTVKPGGFYGETTITGAGYSSATKTGRFICQKCHKLTNSFQGLSIEGNGRGFRDNNYNYMGMSNEAHMEHHNDLTTGQGNCVSCHIAIPHGWKRPRLLVYESDPAPYKVQYIWPSYRDATLSVVNTQSPDLSQGNWGWLNTSPASPAANANGRYQDVTLTNAFTGGLNSTHIEKLSASSLAVKELEIGVPALEYGVYDAANGTKWSKWLKTAEGVIWPGDQAAGAARIDLSVWDAAQNKTVTIVKGDAPIQNNCNACTSAAAGTHAPQNGTNTSGEGVNDSIPYWK